MFLLHRCRPDHLGAACPRLVSGSASQPSPPTLDKRICSGDRAKAARVYASCEYYHTGSICHAAAAARVESPYIGTREKCGRPARRKPDGPSKGKSTRSKFRGGVAAGANRLTASRRSCSPSPTQATSCRDTRWRQPSSTPPPLRPAKAPAQAFSPPARPAPQEPRRQR